MLSDSTISLPPYQQGSISFYMTAKSGRIYEPEQSQSGDGGRLDLEARIARLESDVEYIKRDIGEIKTDVKSVDSRLSRIETGITSMKTTLKATAAVVSAVFVFCAYVFGSYVSKIIEAINNLVLQ
ncbi:MULTISPECIES: hemolysin XhlA family protein [Symbiopectobacterium]|uniref:hemolysin XhlA family protein n=1 Tax=Symbiopectobacterium TaxID=801 RepID=UPI001A1F97FE|nr:MULTISPECIES: hemolysin XhlA family protein [Symbiopectobacterium]MBG6248363.1 hemolysin XhlA [Candidatus Symbiopectobacterium sp. PLON1]MBT9430274.1 hemolysin XhlA [Candidatus Symbiopectobacterium endolongispinus]